mmetsp:Transcript_29849/g.91611  ORF Transcript_29849/g.91611 Transcript_29849/m.91611 type:complete len:573 (-) Transcript_29849:252-1970(-)|eukprot:scaffold256535_cov32-Tisochrysis_lutea.AAC.1
MGLMQLRYFIGFIVASSMLAWLVACRSSTQQPTVRGAYPKAAIPLLHNFSRGSTEPAVASKSVTALQQGGRSTDNNEPAHPPPGTVLTPSHLPNTSFSHGRHIVPPLYNVSTGGKATVLLGEGTDPQPGSHSSFNHHEILLLGSHPAGRLDHRGIDGPQDVPLEQNRPRDASALQMKREEAPALHTRGSTHASFGISSVASGGALLNASLLRMEHPAKPFSATRVPKMSDPWHTLGDGYMFVHVLCSRFSLGQGKQVALTASRLALFASICLPSIRAQTDQRFVWIIYVDSSLSKIDRMIIEQGIGDLPNAVVVALNARGAVAAYEAPCSKQLEMAGWSSRLRPGPWASGREKIYISTRLDADDGLERTFFSRIHKRILLEFERRANGSQGNNKLFLCHLRAVTWFPASGGGAGVVSTEENKYHECLTPGLTLASFSSKAHSVHAISHTEVRKRYGKSALLLDGSGRWRGPVRARTVTSDGLKGVQSASDTSRIVRASLRGKWQTAESGVVDFDLTYGIQMDELRRANAELVRLEAAVAAERTMGKDCVQDFSCATHLDKSALSKLYRISGG